jgi:diguanylate cyclase (GGDEF)-like protein
MAASALFAWHFALEPLLDRPFDSLVLWGTVGAGVLLQVAVAAVVKVLLAGTGPVHPASLRVLCLGLFAGSFMAGVSAFIADNSEVVPSQLVMGPLAFTATLAAARQRRAAKTGAASRVTRGRRPFSLLPYAAVAATQILLIATVGDPHTGAAVVAGAVLVTALVVVRQWGAFTEISRLLATVRSQEERLRHQATHDALTHLANRTLFGERLEGELQQDAAPAVLLIDLDDFKTVNDTLGHAVGDELLQVVADRLRACVRPGDMVARLGGDEFAILLAGVDHGAAEEVARRIMARLEQPAQVGSHHLPVGASVGVAMAATGDDAGSLLRNADIAMYSAKRGGKADVAWYSGGMASAEGVPVASRERFSQALLPQREC